MEHISHIISKASVSYYFIVVTVPGFTGEERDTSSDVPRVTRV